MHLSPRYPYNYLSQLGMAYGLARRYDEAITTLQSATIRNPDHLPAHLHLALSYSELSRDAEARAEVAELLRISPNFSLEGFRRVMPFKNPADLESIRKLSVSLRGLFSILECRLGHRLQALEH